jgi:hypothetical protein
LGQCGTLQPGFGYVDFCKSAALSNVSTEVPPQLEVDQTSTTFYTGQLINLSWASTNIQPDEMLKITYLGSSQRTLTTGSGVNSSAAFFSARLSDSTNSLTPYPVPVQVSSITNPSIIADSRQLITVLQSRITNITVYDDTNLVTTGTVSIIGQNLTIMWRGVGQAQLGTASVTIRSGGGGTTVGTPITGITVTSTTTVYYLLPRTFNPNGGSTYSAQITVTSGTSSYTGASSSFRLAAGPSTSPSSSATSTPTLSTTPSVTPSVSFSPTASPTLSPTPTPSQTPAPSIDILGAARAAAEETNNRNAAIGGGAAGGLFVAGLLGFIAYKAYERKQLRERRLRKQRSSHRNAMNREVYGISEEKDHAEKPTVVMYQIQGLPRNSARNNQLAGYQSRNTRNL